MGLITNHVFSCLDQVTMTFQVKQAGDFSDDDMFFLKAESVPQYLSLLIGLEERIDFHATVNRMEFFCRCDPVGEQLFCHGVSNADQGVTFPGCVAFATAE